ncbi:hypothetical protein M0R45_002145 [Rubus argutus]|uniref:Uncharacterized protein n=1 Tax=Rubus argutus TaxID=59490 RepID=A0AAW1VJD0_RUBAR
MEINSPIDPSSFNCRPSIPKPVLTISAPSLFNQFQLSRELDRTQFTITTVPELTSSTPQPAIQLPKPTFSAHNQFNLHNQVSQITCPLLFAPKLQFQPRSCYSLHPPLSTATIHNGNFNSSTHLHMPSSLASSTKSFCSIPASNPSSTGALP